MSFLFRYITSLHRGVFNQKIIGKIVSTLIQLEQNNLNMVLYIRTATELLHRQVEYAAAHIGLFINVGKTKVMNLGDQVGDLQSRSGEAIENVEDFIYLGSWIDVN